MTVKNIFAVRNDRFGEFLLNIPAFNALKRNYPQARLVAAVNPEVLELARCINSVDEVFPMENRKYGLFEVLSISRALKGRKFDVGVVFNPSKYVNAIVFFAGIPVRAGYDRKAAFFLTHKIGDKKFLGIKHEIEYNLELVSFSGDARDKTLALNINADTIKPLWDEHHLSGGRPVVALHPWTSDAIKQWPREYFLELAKKIADSLQVQLVVVGGKSEAELSRKFFSGASKNIIDLTGKTSLVELGALLKKCALLISGDSGPVHLASCVQTPVIALFRNDIPGKSPTRWGPRSQKSLVIAKPRLEDITVEEVFEQVKITLKR